jgi:hypothetical protein
VSVSVDSVVVLSGDALSSNVDGDVAILSLSAGEYFGLSGVGAFTWEHLRDPRRVGDVCDLIVDHFDVSASVCEVDLLRLLTELESEGLVQVVS